MRTRKRRGQRPAAVTFTQEDLMALCYKHAKDLGFPVADRIYIKVPLEKGKKVEVQIDLTRDVPSWQNRPID